MTVTRVYFRPSLVELFRQRRRVNIGHTSDLELPNHAHEKSNVIEIADMEVTSGQKRMKKGRSP